MKNLKQKFIFAFVMALSAAVVLSASSAEAEIKVTFVNKTDRTISVATLVYGAGTHTKGWYNVQPGKSRTVALPNDIPASLADGSTGYYAIGKKKGAKTVYWRGKAGNNYLTGDIHPTKSFDSSESQSGMEEVGFRELKGGWKVNGNTATKTVNLTLN